VVVPEEWKRANITPLLKKGSRSEPGNYRPVSLASYLSKILESIIKEKMFSHLLDNCFINSSQHGFMPKNHVLLIYWYFWNM